MLDTASHYIEHYLSFVKHREYRRSYADIEDYYRALDGEVYIAEPYEA